MEAEDGGTQVRRTSRARKVNPRLFVGDDIDENYMKLVGRITASNYSGKNDKDGLKDVSGELSSDAMHPDGRLDENQPALGDDASGENSTLSSNKSCAKNTSCESGSFNIALKTVSLKKIKKSKKNPDSLGSENKFKDSFKTAASIIVRYRSSTESEASEDFGDTGLDSKRKLNALGGIGQVKRLRVDYENNSSQRTHSSEKSEGESSGRTSVSASLSSIHETKVFNQQNSSNLSENAFSVPVNPKIDVIKSPFHSVLNPFVSISNKIDPKQPKIVLTSEPKLNLPGKKLKIVALKPLTTLKENLTPEERSSPILENASNKFVLGQDGPVELKIIKKDSFPMSVANLPPFATKVVPEVRLEPKQQSVKLPNRCNESSASANWFSSDGEDDIPLKRLIQKKGTSKKKKLLQKDLKLQKQKLKKNISSKIIKSELKKKPSDQDDLPLKLLLKKSKILAKAPLVKSKALIMKKRDSSSEPSGKKVDVAGFATIPQLTNVKKVADLKKKIRPQVAAEETCSENFQASIKLKEGKPLKMKRKFKNLDSKMSPMKRKGSLSLNKKFTKGGLKKINKLRFKFPQKKIKRDVPLTNETTNIVISVSGLEGDYACLAIDKDHISSQSGSGQPSLRERSDIAKMKTKKKVEESITPIKKYTFNSGLVLEEDVPVDSSNTKASVPKDFKISKMTKDNEEMKLLSDDSLEESPYSKTILCKESKKMIIDSTPDFPKIKFKIPKDLKRSSEGRTTIDSPITSKVNKKESCEPKDRKGEDFGHLSEAKEVKESKFKDEFVDRSDKIDFSYTKFDNLDRADLESTKDTKKEGGQCSSLEMKPKYKYVDKTEVKLEMEWKNKEKEKHKGEKIKKSEKQRSEKDGKKSKDKHLKSSDKKERLSTETASPNVQRVEVDDRSLKKERNEKVEAVVKTEKETGKWDISSKNPARESRVDPSPKKVEKESKVDSSLKKEKESYKDGLQSTLSSVKGKKKENFEEALSGVPFMKPPKSKSEGLKSHDKKVDKEERKSGKEKRKDSKEFKQEITDDGANSRERDYITDSSKSNEEEATKVKKEEKPRHKDERRHSSSSSKSEERRKSSHDSERSEKDRKRKREEEEKKPHHHSSHKKHKKDRSESRRRRSHSSSEERRLKHHVKKESKRDREDTCSSKQAHKSRVSDDAEKDRVAIKTEDSKEIILSRITDPEKSNLEEDTLAKKAVFEPSAEGREKSEAETLHAKNEVKPEVVIGEEYLVSSNIVKEENCNASERDIIMEDIKVDILSHPPNQTLTEPVALVQELKKEREPLENRNERKEETLEMSAIEHFETERLLNYTEFNQKEEEVRLSEELNEVDPLDISQNEFVEEYYKNKENDDINDLGILQELRDFKEQSQRNDENTPTLDTQGEQIKDALVKDEFSAKCIMDVFSEQIECEKNDVKILSSETATDRKLPLTQDTAQEREVDKSLDQTKHHTFHTKEKKDSSLDSPGETLKDLKEAMGELSNESLEKASLKELFKEDEKTSSEESKAEAVEDEVSENFSEELTLESTDDAMKCISKKSSAEDIKDYPRETLAKNIKNISKQSSVESTENSSREPATENIEDDCVKELATENVEDCVKESSTESIRVSSDIIMETLPKESSNEIFKDVKGFTGEILTESSKDNLNQATKEATIDSPDVAKESPEKYSQDSLKMNEEVHGKGKDDKKFSGKESLIQSKRTKSSKGGISMKDYIYRSVFQFAPPSKTNPPASEVLNMSIPLSSIPLPGETIPLGQNESKAFASHKESKKPEGLCESRKTEGRTETKKYLDDSVPQLPQVQSELKDTKNSGIHTGFKTPESHSELKKTEAVGDAKEVEGYSELKKIGMTADDCPSPVENQNNFDSTAVEITYNEKENTAPEESLNASYSPNLLQMEEKVKLPPRELTPEEKEERDKEIVEERLKSYESLDENLYLVDRVRSKRSKEAKRMVCDCTLSKEETANNEMGCGDECLNRLLLIECGSRCPLNDLCLNKRFQQKKYAKVDVFNADEKGCGVRACEEIQLGTFIMEYIGEVFDTKEFKRRRKEYAKESSAHFYFMALRPDRLIDATRKGNISRFINHSCSPNAETQKWTVNGDIRIGFFATKTISVGEEINFDYRLERYGREPQKCFCGTPECRGWLGEPPDQKTKEEKEEDRKREMRDRQRREGKRSFFEDMDLEDEIVKLTVRGLRNRQDTLNLSRLMVRCEDSSSRLSLLKLLESGEEASKRLFLDYHGLKLLWSWMVDVTASHKCTPLKIEILKTLKCLPITNKTQVMDSKILSVVERWSKVESKSDKIENESDVSKETSSDKKMSDGSEDSDAEASEAKDGDPSSSETVSPDDSSSQDSTEVSAQKAEEEEGSESLSPEESIRPPSTIENEMTVKELSSRLLAMWSDLKEAFRIPKKERIEMMKEHERQVEKEYAKYLDTKKEGDRTQAFYDRWRYSSGGDKERDRERHRERDRRRDKWRARRKDEEDDKGLSKEERRERFAMQVAKEDEEARQRKLQEEMWKLHLERCTLLGHDPYFTPIFDPSGQYYWDPGAKTWQAYVGPSGNLPVPASYGVMQQDADLPLGQMFLPDAFYPLPHTPVSDVEGAASESPETDTALPLDPSTIPLPGEQPPPKSPTTTTDVPPTVTIPLPGEEPEEANGMETPPLASPGPVTITLPLRWKMARDTERRIYFYHTRTRHTQWELPTDDLHQQLMARYGINSDSESDIESDSDSSSSSDSEDFSSDEEESEDEECERPLVQQGEAVDEKMIRRPRGRRGHSEKLVQERVISPILFEDREAARRERKEAKERAREEARKERYQLLRTLRGGVAVPKVEVDLGSAEEAAVSPNDHEDDDLSEEQLSKLPRKQKSDVKTAHKAKSKERAATAMADTSELARKIKDNFRARMATYIVSVLNPYRKPDCKEGRITSNDDFKYLARKLTHFVMVKELKQLPSVDGLDCSESVKHKTKEFVRKYMSKYGDTFKRDPNDTKEY